MSANALLVRWAGGWSEVRDDVAIGAQGRREALLGLGAVHGREEMERMARAQLATYAETRNEIACDLVPQDLADTPYIGFGLGDTITVPARSGGTAQDRIIAVTVTEDDDGVLSFAPEISDVILRRPERTSQALKKMVDGTMQGDSRVATPVANIQTNSGIAAPAAAVGGGVPVASLMGHINLASGEFVRPPVAERWYQSASADAYFEVAADFGGHYLHSLQACEVLGVVQLFVPGGFGDEDNCIAGMFVYSDTAGLVDDSSFYDLYAGTRRTDTVFVSGGMGITFSRTYRVPAGAFFLADIYQNTGEAWTVYWKQSLMVLDPTTQRILPGGVA